MIFFLLFHLLEKLFLKSPSLTNFVQKQKNVFPKVVYLLKERFLFSHNILLDLKKIAKENISFDIQIFVTWLEIFHLLEKKFTCPKIDLFWPRKNFTPLAIFLNKKIS